MAEHKQLTHDEVAWLKKNGTPQAGNCQYLAELYQRMTGINVRGMLKPSCCGGTSGNPFWGFAYKGYVKTLLKYYAAE